MCKTKEDQKARKKKADTSTLRDVAKYTFKFKNTKMT